MTSTSFYLGLLLLVVCTLNFDFCRSAATGRQRGESASSNKKATNGSRNATLANIISNKKATNGSRNGIAANIISNKIATDGNLNQNSEGGYSGIKPADENVKQILKKVQPDVEKAECKNFTKFVALNFTQQVVSGMMYRIKVKTEDGYMHVEVYQPFGDADPELKGYETGKSREDDLKTPLKRQPATTCEPQNMPGGYSEEKPADGYVRAILKKVQPQVEKELWGSKQFSKFEALSYTEQIFANGKNYRIQVQTDEGNIVVEVYQSDPELRNGDSGKTVPLPQPDTDECNCDNVPPTPAGAFSQPMKADENIKDLTATFKDDVLKILSKTSDKFEAISYVEQIVAGTIYIIKVAMDDEYAHVTIYVPLSGSTQTASLTNVVGGKTLDDDLVESTDMQQHARGATQRQAGSQVPNGPNGPGPVNPLGADRKCSCPTKMTGGYGETKNTDDKMNEGIRSPTGTHSEGSSMGNPVAQALQSEQKEAETAPEVSGEVAGIPAPNDDVA